MDRYGAKEMKAIGMEKQIHLQPISEIHTNADLQHDLTAAVSPSFLSMLSLIAVLIQVIACINFMNLSTARAAKRAKEVGVRKVIGAGRSDLIRQFLGESLLLSFIGVVLALPLLFILLPYLFLLICIPNSPSFCTVMVSCHTGDYKSLLDRMSAIWRRNVPGAPFEYAFLDEDVQKLYEADITLAKIINAFTAMAVLVSCLGLFGLAAFSAEQRSKEIGVRKVLGASIAGVVRLLSADFLKLVGIALLISVPVSWWAMNKWLAAFAYRVPMRWWMFGLSGLLAVLVAFLTVSFHTIRAASANPVRSLRAD